MTCLQKPFDAPSLPALVNKIVHASYEQVKGPYSDALKLLIREMLKVNPDHRPNAANIQKQVQKHYSIKNKNPKKPRFNEGPAPAICYSVLYQFDIENVSLSVVPTMPTKLNIKQLVISQSHYLILTEDSQIYSWGNNDYGQVIYF
jgi:NIMA (never in mitosis gene a)-related kinase